MKEKEVTIKYLSTELNLSDRKIAEIFNKHRNGITQYRRYHNINKPLSIGRQGELLVIEELNKYGHSTLDMNVRDKTSLFDILVDGITKVEVKTSSLSKEGRFHFALSNKKECMNVESDIRIKYRSGRTRKKYEVTADYFIFVGIDKKTNFWIVPTDEINSKAQTLSITKDSKAYKIYMNNFDLLKERYKWQLKLGGIWKI